MITSDRRLQSHIYIYIFSYRERKSEGRKEGRYPDVGGRNKRRRAEGKGVILHDNMKVSKIQGKILEEETGRG